MRLLESTVWVVYRMASFTRHVGRNAVCTQAEWDEKEVTNPGQNTLIRSGIANEGEAERLARDLQTPVAEPTVARAGGRRVATPPTPLA